MTQFLAPVPRHVWWQRDTFVAAFRAQLQAIRSTVDGKDFQLGARLEREHVYSSEKRPLLPVMSII
jgi:hypothetical protein